MKHQRPKNLNFFTIRFPVPALVSILHRISGIILVLLIPTFLWALNLSLSSQEDFDHVRQFLMLPFVRFIIGCCLAAFIYHFIAGIRHLLMDIHIGEGLRAGRFMAFATLIISILLIIGMGVWLW